MFYLGLAVSVVYAISSHNGSSTVHGI
jgi:hypothetical protein